MKVIRPYSIDIEVAAAIDKLEDGTRSKQVNKALRKAFLEKPTNKQPENTFTDEKKIRAIVKEMLLKYRPEIPLDKADPSDELTSKVNTLIGSIIGTRE